MKFRLTAKALHWLLAKKLALPSAGHLHNLDGSLYMGRWWVIRPDSCAARALKFVSGGRYESVRLHHIRQGDADRELHSHPFSYTTMILDGWYEEEKLDDKSFTQGVPYSVKTNRRVHTAGSVAHMASSYHRIARVSVTGVWTLFFMGKNRGSWGFLMPNAQPIDRKGYFRLKGYTRGHAKDKPKDFQP